MGFVGEGSNIAIATTLPPSFFCIVLQIFRQSMESLYLIFYACLRLRFLDVETNPGPQRPVPTVYRILCRNARGLSRNLSNITLNSSPYDILLCSETLVSYMHHLLGFLVPEFGPPVLLCRGKLPWARGMAACEMHGCSVWLLSVWLFSVCG